MVQTATKFLRKLKTNNERSVLRVPALTDQPNVANPANARYSIWRGRCKSQLAYRARALAAHAFALRVATR